MTRERVEAYTCKLDTCVRIKSATINIVASAQRGSVEDVNEALNRLIATLRELDQETETP